MIIRINTIKGVNMNKDYENNCGLDLSGCKFLGEGHHGKVFLMEDGKVIKICTTVRSCKSEYLILKKVNGSKYFPRVYKYEYLYMIRDYVGGECMRDYIKTHGLSKVLALNVINLLEEFKRLKFTKIDIRCKDIFVQEKEKVMVIDPKGCYSRHKKYPSHLIKGLKKSMYLEKFLKVLKNERPDLYEEWILNGYLK
nr:protein kinase [Clostridium novyi]